EHQAYSGIKSFRPAPAPCAEEATFELEFLPLASPGAQGGNERGNGCIRQSSHSQISQFRVDGQMARARRPAPSQCLRSIRTANRNGSSLDLVHRDNQ